MKINNLEYFCCFWRNEETLGMKIVQHRCDHNMTIMISSDDGVSKIPKSCQPQISFRIIYFLTHYLR